MEGPPEGDSRDCKVIRIVLASLMLCAVQTAHRRSPYVGALSMDAATGRVLFEENADREAYPASVTKLMTLLLALMVKSANDAAIALGVHASGSLDAFVERMNKRAASLGMAHTRYYNPNGLPPKKRNATKAFNGPTCRYQAKLARLLVKMPQVFRYTSAKIGTVTDGGGKPLKFVNHNNLLVKNKLKVMNPDGTEAVDGLKTGYIDAGGSSIVLTGRRGGHRAIVVVLGSASSPERDENAGRLLTDALGALCW